MSVTDVLADRSAAPMRRPPPPRRRRWRARPGLEGTWRSELNPANRPDGWQPPIIPVTFYFDLPPGSRVADSFEVDYRIGEGPKMPDAFYNGLDQ